MKKPNILFSLMTFLIVGNVTSRPDCSPCRCVVDTTYGGIKAVCSNLNLTNIPRTLPWNTTTLLIRANKLNNQSLPFPSFKNLQYLDMTDNDIREIGNHVFDGLTHLKVLLLGYNQLYTENHVFDPQFVKPLTSLQNLSFVAEYSLLVPNVTYECTSCPDSLQFLYIDFLSCRFGSSFLKLWRLSMLSLNPIACEIPVLDTYTFQYTPYLEILKISKCEVQYVEPGMFDSLKKLRILSMDITLNYGNEFQAFMEVTKSLQYSPLKYISFSTHRTYRSYPDMFSYLENSSLRELHVSCANVPLIQRENFRKLPKSLVVLSLINIRYDFILTEIKHHPSLKTLDLSRISVHSDDFALKNLSPVLETYICRQCPHILLSFPIPNKNITHFITPRNAMNLFTIPAMKSLSKVEYFDFSHNFIHGFAVIQNNSVTSLNLAYNRIENSLTGPKSVEVLSLFHLKLLDLSHNGVSLVSNYALKNLLSAELINLSNNHLSSINVRLGNLSKLKVFDLSNNQISTIGADMRQDISRLSRVKLHLEGNPLVCGCEQFDSLLWMKQNPDKIYKIASLRCRMSTGDYKTLDRLDQIIDILESECKSDLVKITVSVGVTISVITIVVCVLLYRHRWKLRYLYYAGRRGYRQRYNRGQVNQEQYEYDAFVSYDDEDRRFVIDEMMQELEEKHGLKLCIHQRDFLPGEVIADNIVNAIQNSRKTIVVLSPSFLESTWCEFEFNMARMEGVTRRQDVVLVLLYKDVPMMNLSKDMATMLKRNCYIEYNHELFNREVFWFLVQESTRIIMPRD